MFFHGMNDLFSRFPGSSSPKFGQVTARNGKEICLKKAWPVALFNVVF